MKNLQKYTPHFLAFLGFILVSLIYFYPVLQGKKIYQSDIVQYTGMAKEQNDFRKQTNQEPYWTNSAFGGMPTYQLGANYPHNYIKKLDNLLRFLPRPADYLFLYFLGFYVLLLVLKVDYLKAFFGALAFGFSTYLIIILGVGHNAKAHAIAYMPLVVAGVLLVFQKRYILGGILTMLAVALEIQANHPQMTYYLLFLLMFIGVYYAYKFIKAKDYKNLGIASVIFVTSSVIALGTNATNLMATAEYAKFSTRSNSELTYNPDGTKKENSNALSYDYITEYSYGVLESLNLISPRLFGGSNAEQLTEDSEMFKYLVNENVPKDQAKEIIKQMPTYWGDQPIVAAPAYIGAVVFFLAIIGLFLEPKKIKYVFLAGVIFSLLMSWGKNFTLLTDFFINYIPLYNKFRAVSSIQVILELCMPILAILGLYNFFKADAKERFTALWKAGTIAGGILIVLLIFKYQFSFSGGNDGYYIQNYGQKFINALKTDREAMFMADLGRSFLYIALVFGVLFASIKNIFTEKTTVILVGLLMVFDLVLIDKTYVNKEDFVSARDMDIPFTPSEADLNILHDTTNFRVFDVDGNLNSARASYFHKSVGGYHAAKPKRMQQLFDYQIAKNNMKVLNMLNTKYVLQQNEKGEQRAMYNVAANGNSWFVNNIKIVNTADQEMKTLDSLQSKKEAVLHKNFSKNLKTKKFTLDSLANIRLVNYKPNYLKYISENKNDGFAIFSEIYYPKGWIAKIDGKETEILNANYVLRALQIPKGEHIIEFSFQPQVVKTGSLVSLISSLLMLLLILGGIYVRYFKKK